MNIFGGYNAGLAPGAIMLVAAGSAIPDGFLYCDGSAISRELYPELFAVIGTRYGEGDGSTTFNIPSGIIRVLPEKAPVYSYINSANGNVYPMVLETYDHQVKYLRGVNGFNNEVNLRATPVHQGDTNIISKESSTPAHSTTVYADLSGQYINILIKYRW